MSSAFKKRESGLLTFFKSSWGKGRIDGPFCLYVAVSGGADSMALLDTACHFSDSLVVMHLNHLLRGNQAEEDMNFVENYCKAKNINFINKSVDIKAKSKEENISEELAGRNARYEFFEDVMAQDIKSGKIGTPVLLTGHHLGDQAETVLLHIFRGTGLSGISGMSLWEDRQAVKGEVEFAYKIFRPLLEFPKEDLMSYCEKQGIDWREDPSNQSTEYTRNAIRKLIIPKIEQEINPNLKDGLLKLSRIAKTEHDYIEKETERAYMTYVFDGRSKTGVEAYEGSFEDGGYYERRNAALLSSISLNKRIFGLEHEAIISNLIIKIMEEISGQSMDKDRQILSYDRIKNIIELGDLNVGKRMVLYDMIILSDFFSLQFIGREGRADNREPASKSSAGEPIEIPLEMLKRGDDFSIEWGFPHGKILARKCMKMPDLKRLKNPRFCYLDIGGPEKLFLRSGQGNEVMEKFGGRKKALRKIFNEWEIPSILRENYPLLTDRDKIIWIPTAGRSSHFPIVDGRPILELEWRSTWTKD